MNPPRIQPIAAGCSVSGDSRARPVESERRVAQPLSSACVFLGGAFFLVGGGGAAAAA